MAEIVVVTGTPGAGKTTIINSIKDAKKYEIVGVGSMMEKVAEQKGYATNRDKIRYLSNDKLTELRTETFKAISAMKGKVIMDTHASVVKKRRFIPGLPFYVLKLLKGIKAFIYLDATAEDIISRRLKDKTRIREIQNKAAIDDQRTINISTLAYYASYLNIPLYIIENKEGQLHKTIEEFSESMDEIFGGNDGSNDAN